MMNRFFSFLYPLPLSILYTWCMKFCVTSSSKTSLLFALICTEIIFVIYDQRPALSGCIHFLSFPFLVSHFYFYLVLLPKKAIKSESQGHTESHWWCFYLDFLPCCLGCLGRASPTQPLNSNPSSKLLCQRRWCTDAGISSANPVLHWCFSSRFLIMGFFSIGIFLWVEIWGKADPKLTPGLKWGWSLFQSYTRTVENNSLLGFLASKILNSLCTL